MNKIIPVFLLLFLLGCQSLSTRQLDDGIVFSYKKITPEIQQSIRLHMKDKCEGNEWFILSTEQKDEEKIRNFAFTTYNDNSSLTNFVQRKSIKTSYETTALCYPDEYNEEYIFEIADIPELKFSDKSKLLPQEKNILLQHYSNCRTPIGLNERRKACLQAMLLVENIYKTEMNRIPNPEKGLLFDSANTYCLIDPDNCYTCRDILKLQQKEKALHK